MAAALTLISALDATRPFPERKWSLSVLQQARFPDFRLKRVASGLPNLTKRDQWP